MWRKMAPKTNELNLIFVFIAHLLALVLDLLLSQTQTGAPFIQSDEVIVVDVARVEERTDAVLEGHQWGADREQFVAGHFPVRWVSIEITELPDGSIGPLAAQILLGFTFQFEEVRAQIMSVGQVPHDVEQPITHAAREVHHFISRAFWQIFAGSEVLDVGVVVLGVDAVLGAFLAQAAHAVQVTVRVPRLVLVAADHATGIFFLGTSGNTPALGFALFVDTALTAGTAVFAGAGIDGGGSFVIQQNVDGILHVLGLDGQLVLLVLTTLAL